MPYYFRLIGEGLPNDEDGPLHSIDFLLYVAPLRELIRDGKLSMEVRRVSRLNPGQELSTFTIDQEWIRNMWRNLDAYLPGGETYDSVQRAEEERRERQKEPDTQTDTHQSAKTDTHQSTKTDTHQSATSKNPEEANQNRRERLATAQQKIAEGQEVLQEYGLEPIDPDSGNDDEVWVPDVDLIRGTILEIVEDRVSKFLTLTQGEYMLDQSNATDLKLNNDGIERAILDGYVTIDEIVDTFRNVLSDSMENIAYNGDRIDQEKLIAARKRSEFNADDVDKEPTFLQSYPKNEDWHKYVGSVYKDPASEDHDEDDYYDDEVPF